MSLSAPVARDARSDFAVVAALLPYLRPYSGRIAVALVLVLAAKLVNLLVPVALKRIVDELDVEPSLLLVPVALLLSYGAARIGVTLFTELRQVVFARVMARPRGRSPGRCSTICTDYPQFHLDRRTGGVARDVERGGAATRRLTDAYTILPTALEGLLARGVGGLRTGALHDHWGHAAASLWDLPWDEWRHLLPRDVERNARKRARSRPLITTRR